MQLSFIITSMPFIMTSMPLKGFSSVKPCVKNEPLQINLIYNPLCTIIFKSKTSQFIGVFQTISIPSFFQRSFSFNVNKNRIAFILFFYYLTCIYRVLVDKVILQHVMDSMTSICKFTFIYPLITIHTYRT